MQPDITGITLSAATTPARFLQTFVSRLVLDDWPHINPFETNTRRALSGIVAFLDCTIVEFKKNGVAIPALAPFLNIANRLRPSPLGGMERWEYQLRTLYDPYVQPGNSRSGIIDFSLSKTSAKQHLEDLTEDQTILVNQIMDVFNDLYCNPVPDAPTVEIFPAVEILPDSKKTDQ